MPGKKPIPVEKRFFNFVHKTDKCWIWTGTKNGPGGYGIIGIGSMLDNSRKMMYAHRLSWNIFKGKIPTNLWVLHKCDVKSCVNPNHLFLGTIKDNALDAMKKSITARGTRLPQAKLKEKDIPQIRKHILNQLPYPEIGRKYGVCPGTIGFIARGITWKHV